MTGLLVVGTGGVQWLCDERASEGEQACAGVGLRLVGTPRFLAEGFVGIKRGDSLLSGYRVRPTDEIYGLSSNAPRDSNRSKSSSDLGGTQINR